MTSKEQYDADMAEIDVETTRIADLFTTLLAQLAAGTITLEDLQAKFDPEIAKLRAIGTTP